MLGVSTLVALFVAQGPAPPTVEQELRRAKNEYAYGNYVTAVESIRDLLYPMRLTSDEQVVEARKYLALSYYLLERYDEVGDEFAKLLHLDPDYELDPFTVAPPVIEMFEQVRQKLKPQLDVIRQLRSDSRLEEPPKVGVEREIERTVTQRSDFMTFMPFGAGQIQNGDLGWGVLFAFTELALLAVNVAAYLYSVYGVGDYDEGDPEQRQLVQGLVVTQYASLALFGVTWSLGVFHARLRFVPAVEAPPVVRETPLGPGRAPSRRGVGASALLNVEF
jgi:tetratricopeptide (TPR) repeat protein